MARLQLVRAHIDFNAQVLELGDNVLRCSHGVIVLVPASDLVLVDGQQPRDQTDEVNELLRGLRGSCSEVGLRDRFESPIEK